MMNYTNIKKRILLAHDQMDKVVDEMKMVKNGMDFKDFSVEQKAKWDDLKIQHSMINDDYNHAQDDIDTMKQQAKELEQLIDE